MKKVLIIDDEPLVRETMVAFLQDLDFLTFEACDGYDGIDMFLQAHPDIILVDLRMPRMDGIEFIKRMKKISADTPIIVVSGNGMLEEAIRAIRLGAWDYITKPVLKIEALNYSIEKALDRSALIQQNKEYALKLEASNKKLRQTNLELKSTLTKLEEEEEAGRRIQFQLLPQKKLEIADYELDYYFMPSRYVTGDFVDYFGIDENHFGFYIADVSGHGVSSAFVTVLIKSHINKYLERYPSGDWTILDPGKLLAMLNEQLIAEKIDKFTTIFYGVINIPDNHLKCANGGQFPYPIIKTDEKCQFLQKKSMVVGMLDEAEYETIIIKLPEKFKIVMISDGILDIMDEEDIDVKQQNMLTLTSSNYQNLEELVEKFNISSDFVLPDDITFLMVNKV